jgi:hypothetical protein
MAGFRKSRDASLVVEGERSVWLGRAGDAMERAGFDDIDVNETLGLVTGRYHHLFAWGKLEVTLRPATGGTEVHMHATANVYALFVSPTGKMIEAFEKELGRPALTRAERCPVTS